MQREASKAAKRGRGGGNQEPDRLAGRQVRVDKHPHRQGQRQREHTDSQTCVCGQGVTSGSGVFSVPTSPLGTERGYRQYHHMVGATRAREHSQFSWTRASLPKDTCCDAMKHMAPRQRCSLTGWSSNRSLNSPRTQCISTGAWMACL